VRIFSYILLFFIVLLGLSFAILNAAPVTLNYYWGSKQISLSLLLVFSVMLGALLAGFTLLFSLWRYKAENYHLKHKIKKAEQEINNLRSLSTASLANQIQDKH
jgi:putative membrane protein